MTTMLRIGGALVMTLVASCGQSSQTTPERAASARSEEALKSAEPQPIECRHDDISQKLAPPVVGKGPDVHYRAPASDKAELKAKMQRENNAPSAPFKVSPTMIEQQGRYLQEVSALRAKHGAAGESFEKERVALKERMLGNQQ